MRFTPVLLLSALLLTGCMMTPTATPTAEPGVALSGSVHGGQQPVVGAHVYLFAANTTGYGQPSVSLLNPLLTLHSDAVGAYVLTDGNGAWSITADYLCTPNTQVYLYAQGGNPGAGTNAALGLLAVLGNCPATGTFLATLPNIIINELTTVAAANALAGFATDATHVSSSGTALAQTGIANAFANAGNLVSVVSGAALTVTPAGNGRVGTSLINTIGNILAACVNTAGPTATPECSILFAYTRAQGTTGATPTDTASAAINLAHNALFGVNGGANPINYPLFNLQNASNVFAPAFSSVPADYALTISYTTPRLGTLSNLAIDALGTVWSTNQSGAATVVSRVSPLGVDMTAAGGYTTPTAAGQDTLAIDNAGNAWVKTSPANTFFDAVAEFSPSGQLLSGPTGYTNLPGSGLITGIAFDPGGNAWVATATTLDELSPSGAVLLTSGAVSTTGFAIDPAGALWSTSTTNSTVTKTTHAGAQFTSTAFSGALSSPLTLAIDRTANIWFNYLNSVGVSSLSNAGALLSANPFPTYSTPNAVAFDGNNTLWTADSSGFLEQMPTSNGVATADNVIYPAQNPAGYKVIDPAVDGSGNVWVSYRGTTTSYLLQYIGVAVPVVTPIAAGVKGNTLGTRP